MFSPVRTNPEGWFSFNLRLTYLAAATFIADFANFESFSSICLSFEEVQRLPGRPGVRR